VTRAKHNLGRFAPGFGDLTRDGQGPGGWTGMRGRIPLEARCHHVALTDH